MNHFAHRNLVRRLVATLISCLLLWGPTPMVAPRTHEAGLQTGSAFHPWSPPTGQGMTTGKPPAAVLHVPEAFATIQAAVNAARPYDLISIAPGIYHEAVIVRTAHLTIRGRDRNRVILDGNFELGDGFAVIANDVVLENMTVRHYLGNAFYWEDVQGFRGSYLTAYANGDYGVYAYNSNTGQFDHDLAAGQPDSGFYIGGCHPCNAIISQVIAEDNAIGYSGTNAGGNLLIRDSIWRENMVGILPNSHDFEPHPPEDDTTIMNNLAENNNNLNAPAKAFIYFAFGNGIMDLGGKRQSYPEQPRQRAPLLWDCARTKPIHTLLGARRQ